MSMKAPRNLIRAAFIMLLVAGCGYSSDPAGDENADAGTDASGEDGKSAPERPEPAADFFDPAADDVLQFEFRGRINPYDVDYEEYRIGMGEFTATIDGESSKMTTDPLCYLSTVTSSTDTGLNGKKYLGLIGYREIEGTGMSLLADHVNVYIIVDDLKDLKSGGKNLMDLEHTRLEVHRWLVTMKGGGSRLDKVCTVAVADEDNDGSKLFVDHAGNESFEAGEILRAWGNVALTTDPDVILEKNPGLEEYDSMLCLFMKDNVPISKEQYEEELESDGADLSCELPADYLEPFADDYMTIKFNGQINDVDDEYPVYGSVELDISIDGEKYGDAVYSTYVMRGQTTGQEVVSVSVLDNVEQLNDTDFVYNGTGFTMTAAVLDDALESGDGMITDTSGFMSDVSDISLIYEAGGTVLAYYRICPIAVMDVESAQSSAYVCLDDNADFGVGEMLEFAGNVALTTDMDAIRLQYGMASDQDCICAHYNTPIECSEFP